MEPYLGPPPDPRSTDELISAALCESDDEELYSLVHSLQWRGSIDVLHAAARLCGSECAQERSLGARILGQLGAPERTFPTECVEILVRILTIETDSDVISSAAIALSFHHNDRGLSIAIDLATHPSAEVRYSAVQLLTDASHSAESPAIECLIRLSKDLDPHVRDWATFTLGTQSEVDTPELRTALFDRLDDSDDNTRGEALIGLALRRDERVIPALQRELARDEVGSLAVEAAQEIAAPALVPFLVELQSWWDVYPKLLDDALAACSHGRGQSA